MMPENNFMLAIRERRAKIRAERNYRITVMAIVFIVGLATGIIAQGLFSVVSQHNNDSGFNMKQSQGKK